MEYLAGAAEPRVVGRDAPVHARRLDGTEVVVEVGLAPMTTGQQRYVAATLLDVSDRQQARDALLLTQMTVDNAADAIFWIRGDGGIQYANLAGLRLVGQEPEWLRTMHLWDINPAITPEVWQGWWDRMRRDGTLTLDTELHARSGASISVEVRVKHLEHGHDELAVAFVRDITAHKQNERALIDARQAAEEASRAKSSFLANMSHEIRTPLNAVLGFTQMLLRDLTVGHKHRETIKRIATSGSHLLDLIQDILVVSKIDAGRLEITPEVFELTVLLDDLEALFVIPATERGLVLELTADPDLPGWVEADRAKIWQIAVNLVGNAVKYTGKGGVTVRVRIDRAPSSSESEVVGLVLEVEDSGPGIPPDEQELVFERFEQSSRNHSGNGGTGLGLTICKELTGLLGGVLELESEVGKGCLFRCTLPVVPVQASAEQIAAAARGRARGPLRRIVGIERDGPVRVLIVDDVETNRVLLSDLLWDLGFETRQVSDAEAAVAANRRWAPDLILMDLLMPGIGGVEAIRRVRALLDGKQPRILAVTAAAVESTVNEALEAGADAVLSKPVDEQELYAEIARLLDLDLVFEGQSRRWRRAVRPGSWPSCPPS
jgi:PAS domain S-box-containing protein